MASDIQTFIVKKVCARRRAEAARMARDAGARIRTSIEGEDTWEFPQRPLSDFRPDSDVPIEINHCVTKLVGILRYGHVPGGV